MLFELSLINACGVGVMEPAGDEVVSRAERAPGLEVPDDDSFRAPVPFLIGGFAVRPASHLFERPFDVRSEVPGLFNLDVEVGAGSRQPVANLERGPAGESVADAVVGESLAEARGKLLEKSVQELLARGARYCGDAVASCT